MATNTSAAEASVDGTVPDWIHLGEDERVVWRGRPSARAVLPAFFPAIVVAVVGVALALAPTLLGAEYPPWLLPLGVAVVLAGLALATLRYVRWRRVHYLITSNEVYKKRGLLGREVEQLRLSRVENVSHTQSGLQRLLGYGDVVVSTEGSSSRFVLGDVPEPTAVHKHLSAQLDAAARGTRSGASRTQRRS